MLISRVPEEGAGRGEPDAEMARICQTASELFELMTKDHDFESGDDPLTTNDLVLLYKNIDLGNQLMSSVRGRPNQYVENVYHDDPETDSDLSESCSSEELRNIMLTNKERIDLFATPPSLNTLCHKLGDLEIQVSNISSDLYDDRHFLHNDPYIKNQLQSLQLLTKANEINSALFPTSLLDYICCQRLDYNYSSHMENIITYVKHTIDQLKRISNGDYLPDKVKEKWRETKHDSGENTLKGLATSISMPLQMKQKATRLVTAWDDIVHTEMGLQSLVKIMERKIVLEVPRSISDTLNFFSKYRSDDKLVISCSQRKSKSRERERERSAPRVDVVLRAGQLASHIGSLMLLQPSHRIVDKGGTVILPLESIPIKSPELLTSKVMELSEIEQNFESTDNSEEYSTVNVTPNAMELSDIEQNFENKSSHNFGGSSSVSVIPNVTEPCAIEQKFEIKSSDKPEEYSSVCSFLDAGYYRTNHSEVTSNASKSYSTSGSLQAGSPGEMALILSTGNRVMRAEAAANHATPNDLSFFIKSFENQASLLEENSLDAVSFKTKKKSPERVRIKSPYENKSHILEERRRKRLLEVRERRERRKMASKENSKFIKPKSSPQAVSSVTKLSFTNKAFYNSIYGRNGNGDNTKRASAVNNLKERKGTQNIDGVIQEIDQESDADVKREESLSEITLEKLCKNDILDDTETEMSYLQSKQDGDFLKISTTTSVNSNESTTNLHNHSEYCSSLNFLENEQFTPTVLGKLRDDEAVETLKSQDPLSKDATNVTIATKDDSEKEPAIECRRSLEKIYTLMKKLQEIETSETAKKKITFSESRGLKSESGSSLKRRVSFSKPNRSAKHTDDFQNERDEDTPMASVPKVVISAKLQPRNTDEKKGHKMRPPRIRTVPENPLKAISQLLHEFDNVQKSKSQVADPRSINRSVSTENTEQPAKVQKKRALIESPVHNVMKVAAKVKTRFGREAREEEKGKPRVPDKKITDLIDEVKEARGEAVRGPPRFSSRLNALAQPRRAYVQTAELPKRAYVQAAELPKRAYVHAAELPKRPFVQAAELPKRQPLERAHRPASHTPRARARGSPTSVRPPHSLERTRSSKPRRSAAGSPKQNTRDPPPFASLAAAATIALHSLKEKTVATEPDDGCCIQRSSPSRVPLMPRDIQMSSSSSSAVDESTGSFSIGSQLHRMVKDMLLKDKPSSPAHSPSCLATADSDILKATTVTEEFCREETEFEEVISENRHGNEPDDQLDKAVYIIPPANSVTEIAMLEHALHRSLSSGAFGGRLRVNKLTLSPRPSLQRVVMQQSGDTTLVLKSDSYQEIQVNYQTSNEIDLIELLSKTRLNSDFSGFPLQISTVGYAFPTFECEVNNIMPKIVSTEAIETSDAGTSYISSATTMLEIKDGKEETTCQWPMAGASSSKECVNKQVCTGMKNVETSPATFVLVSPADVGNHYKNVPSCEHEENDQPSYKNVETSPATVVLVSPADVGNHYKNVPSCEHEENDQPSYKNVETSPATVVLVSPADVGNHYKNVPSCEHEENDQPSYTSSFDILVGLLNEIQKITTCGTDAASAQTLESEHESSPRESSAPALSSKCTESNVCEQTNKCFSLFMSNSNISSDDQLGFYISETQSVSGEALEQKPVCTDKEVLARVTRNAAASTARQTGLPNDTATSTCTMNAPTKSCSVSVFSVSEYSDKGCNTSFHSDDKIIDHIGIQTSRTSVKSLVPYYNNMCKGKMKKHVMVSSENSVTQKHVTASSDTVSVQKRKKEVTTLTANADDFDSKLKVKRDILVTFYSILVLTVFAALAVPEILQFA